MERRRVCGEEDSKGDGASWLEKRRWFKGCMLAFKDLIWWDLFCDVNGMGEGDARKIFI